MPDLPGSNYDKDKEMFDKILGTYSVKRNFNLQYELVVYVLVLMFELIGILTCNINLAYFITFSNILVLSYLQKIFSNKNFITLT